MGGKSNEKWQICRFLNQIRQPGQLYIEPFVGACNTFAMMDEPKIGVDIHPDLIAMWQAVQCGWEPPDSITEEEYYQLRDSNVVSPLRGFAGFACSYSGKWFGGYARNSKGYNYCFGSKRSLLYKVESITNSVFINGSYNLVHGIRNFLIYCDPPYKWRTEFNNGFNHGEFWEHVRILSSDNVVLTSEMSAPDDFTSVLEITRSNQMNSQEKEHLYLYSG